MAKEIPFESIHIDIEKEIYEINGRDVSESAHGLELSFKKGRWTLELEETVRYAASIQQKN